jgi:integrase
MAGRVMALRQGKRTISETAEAFLALPLHQLRHSAITHLAEANVALPLLMAKLRPASLRSLQRYARASDDRTG